MSDPILKTLEQVADDVAVLRADVIQIRAELSPVTKFYVQASGILAAIRWIGSGGLLMLLAGAVWMTLR